MTAPADPARLEAIAAQLAVLGFVLYELTGDDGRPIFWVRRWGLQRELPDLDAVEKFAEQVATP